MPQDAYTIKYVANELSDLLTGGKISKIAQQQKDLLTFIIYTGKGSVKLEACLSAKGCRLNIAENDCPAPKTAPAFCMLLRKHLQNAEILSLAQIDGERIVYLDFLCTSEFESVKMRIYFELMGKYSNAVLVKDGVIVGALKTTAIGESTKRVLFTGAKYVLPEPQDKAYYGDLRALEKIFANYGGDGAKFISDNVKGVAYSTALDIVATYGERPSASEVYEYLNGEKFSPCVVFSDGAPCDFKVRAKSGDKKLYQSVLAAQTAYYAYVTQKDEFETKKKKLCSALSSSQKKYEKRLAQIEQKLFDCKDAETVKLKGELITANLYALKRGMDGFEAVNYYDEQGGKIKIALDRSLSPADNAQKYYKRYAKLKRTAAAVSEQKEETEKHLDYLSSILSHLSAAENLCDLEETEEELITLGLLKVENPKGKRKQNISPFRVFEVGGYKVLCGRNNLQNDRLLKSVSADDLWMHTQKYHSAHLAIICGGKEIPDKVLLTCAEICAYYSDGRTAGKVPVDYTRRANVKKPPKSAAGFVIYTGYKTVLAEPRAHAELKEED